MASARTCDCDGKIGAKRIEVALTMEGVAHPDKITSLVLGCDACPECQEHVVATLHKHAIEKMREQAPYHAKIELAALARDEAQHEFNTLRPLLQAEYDKNSAIIARAGAERPGQPKMDPDSMINPELKMQRDDVLKRIDAHEAERLRLFEEGTRLSDARDATLNQDLKARPA